MRKVASIPVLVALISGLAVAQGVRTDVDAKSSSKKVISITTSENGKKRTYRKVIQDGKVIEESGDPRLLEDTGLDLRGVLRKAWRDGDVKTMRKGRRIVIRDGKKVIDEKMGDGEGFDFDVDIDAAVKKHLRDALRKAEKPPHEGGKREGRRLRRDGERKKGIIIDKGDGKRYRTHIEVLPEFLKDLDVEWRGVVKKGLRELRDLHLEIPDIKLNLNLDELIGELHRHIPDVHHIIDDVHRHLPEMKGHLKKLRESHPPIDPSFRKIEKGAPDLEHQIQELMRQADELQRELNRLMRAEKRSLRHGQRSRL